MAINKDSIKPVKRHNPDNTPDLPLHGLKVLDLSRVLAGPVCTMMLGDLGADVIKVERPGTGDDTRGWGPPFDADGQSAYFLSVNRNKLSVAVDLGSPRDLALVRTLVAEADVVVDNFPKGTLDRWGLSPRVLLDAHPRLLWCTITGFGADSDRPGYDFVVQAESGWMAINGEPNGQPMRAGVALVDVITGKDAAVSILAALIHRDRPRAAEDRHLVVSLMHSATAALVNVAQNALVTGRDVARWGNAHPNLVPYQLFEARDRPIVIAVGTDAQFAACMRVLQLDTVAADPTYRTNAGRVTHRDELVAIIQARLQMERADVWLSALEDARVPCGVVTSVLEALRAVDASPRTGVAPLAPASVRFAPPALDAHGARIRHDGWRVFESLRSDTGP